MDEGRMIALRLSKGGYGTPSQIEAMPTDVILDALQYDTFTADYESTYLELNKPPEK